jgi:glycosyltransferase involved in cell wall biosynthesis
MTDTVVSNDGRPGTDVAIFVPSMRGGGAERAMLKLAIALSRSGVSLDLVLAKAEGAYIEDIPDDIRVVDLAASRIIASLPGLTAYLRSARPAVLLSSMDHANVVACWARTLSRTRPRLVLNVQNTLSRSAADASMRRGRLVPSLARRTYPGAEAIVTVSKGVASDLADTIGIPRARIEVIHNPVVTPELIARSREPVEDEWFVPGADPVILAVGRLDSQKDYPTLLQAFAALRSNRPARLMILGEGPLREELESTISSLGLEADVRLPGFVENPFSYMRHSSVYVMSSLYEGLPTVVIEALASEARIVSTDCPSGPNEILAGGSYGRLVPMSDSAALATALAAALDDTTPLPGPESWKPYELETVVEQYRRVLLGDGR